MKVVVTGTRGIPGIQGGIETHCEQLYPRLAAMGCDVTVMRRRGYVTRANDCTEYKGVKILDLWTFKNKYLEAALHTMASVFKARTLHPHVLHIHGIGPCLMAPLAKALGMKVVSTHHGCDYRRAKWNRMAKAALKLGQWCQVTFSDRVIAINDAIADELISQYDCAHKISVISNGAIRPVAPEGDGYLRELGLEQGRYVVALARFVPEKRLDLLVDAFAAIDSRGMKLVLAGDSDHEDKYSRALKQKARDAGVLMTGFIKGQQLAQVMAGAALFVLPSAHEGLPISLLEAMSYNLDVLVSDITANRLPELAPTDFFASGDLNDLCRMLDYKLDHITVSRHYDMSRYSWDTIAQDTLEVYRKV